VPRRSTLFKLWDALELTEADKERWSKKKILLSSEALALWEALGKAERVLRETLPLLRLPPQLFRYRQVHIGRRIVELRRARGWNQTEFAEVVGLSKGLIYKLETARWPSDPVMVWSYLERIAKGLGTTLEEILSWV
jgi:DNA-binding XRE family transcriptional regulator